MPAGEFAAGTGFEIALETLGDIKLIKSEVGLDVPRHELGRVNTVAAVVFGDAPFEVVCRTDVSALGIRLASEDVDVVQNELD